MKNKHEDSVIMSAAKRQLLDRWLVEKEYINPIQDPAHEYDLSMKRAEELRIMLEDDHFDESDEDLDSNNSGDENDQESDQERDQESDMDSEDDNET
jgi:hypothetical protein